MRLIYFIESYVAGGSDNIANKLLNNLNFDQLFLFVNKRADLSILKRNLNSKIVIIYYSLYTPNEIHVFFNRFKKLKIINLTLKFFSYLITHLITLYSIIYFYNRFKKLKPTHIISHNGGHPGGLLNRTSLIASAFVYSIKNKYYVYHSNPIKFKVHNIFLDFCLDRLIEKHSKLITISNSAADEILKKRFIKKKPIVIHNGLSKKHIKVYKNDKTLKLLSVGYFDFNKNQILLLKSLTQIENNILNNIHVTFVGKVVDSEAKINFDEFLIKNNLEKNVTIVGFEPNIDKYYYRSDLLICTSFIEGLSLSILEAMSIGLPIISTNTGGVNEQVFNNINGFVIKNNDPKGLSKKILFFYDKREKIEYMGRESYNIFANKFDEKKMINSYSNLLKN